MLQLHSYFEGHGGAITSLTKGNNEQSFYSAGSEGLIVQWNLTKPNEGDVLIKLRGLISAIKYEHTSNTLYAAVNHKGLFVIDIETRKILKTVDIPATSFGKMELTNKFIMLSTHIGELLIIDRETYAIKERIVSGLKEPPAFIVENDNVWYSTDQGINWFEIISKVKATINLAEKPSAIKLLGARLLFTLSNGLYVWNLAKRKVEIVGEWEESLEINRICINPTKSNVIILGKSGVLVKYKIEKKKITKLDSIQIEHNGRINDILWIENHKFVITAGSDKKIGVWQLN